MNKNWFFLKYLTVSLFILIFFETKAQANDFKAVKSSDGITLYERWVMHNGNNVRELKVIFLMPTVNINTAASVLMNAAKGLYWNQKAKQYLITKTSNTHVWLNYIRYSLPWPMQDQDCLLKYYYDPPASHSSQAVIYFKSTSQEKIYPIAKNVTRLSGTEGKWQIDQLSTTQSRITYQIITNKSGNVPRWISDPVIYENILHSMNRFRYLLTQHVSK